MFKRVMKINGNLIDFFEIGIKEICEVVIFISILRDIEKVRIFLG